MRIFLAEPDPDLRVGLQFLIYQNPGCQVIGISDNGKRLKKQIKASRPDVLLLDWYLPGKPMNELITDVQAINLPLTIIVMSIYPEDESAVRAASIQLDEEALKKLDGIFPGPGGEAPEAYSW